MGLPGAGGGGADVSRLLKRARTRIQFGTSPELLSALRILREVLQTDPTNDEAIDLIGSIFQKNLVQPSDIEEVLALAEGPKAQTLRSKLGGGGPVGGGHPAPPPPGGGGGYDPGGTGPTGGGGFTTPDPGQQNYGSAPSQEVISLQEQLTSVYYEGDYHEAINICMRILSMDPGNAQAKEFQLKADDNLKRGVVPDNRIPLQARVSYNRGRSSKRAGLYSEAKRLFEEAINIARNQGGIQRWSDVENELLEMEDLILAKDLTDKADRHAADDRWSDAVELYEGALEIVETPRTRKKLEALNKVSQLYRQVDVQLNVLSGQLSERAKQIQPLQADVAEALTYWPDSPKLMQLMARVRSRASEIGDTLYRRGESSLSKSKTAGSVDERLRNIGDAIRHLESAHTMMPDSPEVDNLLVQAQSEQSRALGVQRTLEDTKRLISLRDRESVDNARSRLSSMSEDLVDYTQDTEYRTMITNLQRIVIDDVEMMMEDPDVDFESVRTRLAEATASPFQILGQNQKVMELRRKADKMEEEAAKAKKWKVIKPFAFAAGAVVLLGILWLILNGTGIIVLPSQYTPTLTPEPTATLTPTLTPSITPSPTITLTPTNTPSPTPTVSTTLCEGITEAGNSYYLYTRPDEDTRTTTTVPGQAWVDILDQTRDDDGALWYKVDVKGGDLSIIGWIPARYVLPNNDCPRLP